MKPKRTLVAISIIVALVFLGFIIKNVYQILCISCTIPPIKTYGYLGSVDQFENRINKFSKINQQITYKDVRAIGDSESGYANDFTVDIKNKTIYITADLRYEAIRSTDVKEVKLSVIGLHDINNHKGGYGINADGMKELLHEFEKDYLIPLQSSQHLVLTPSD